MLTDDMRLARYEMEGVRVGTSREGNGSYSPYFMTAQWKSTRRTNETT